MWRTPSLIGGHKSQQSNGFHTPKLNELQVIRKSNHGATWISNEEAKVEKQFFKSRSSIRMDWNLILKTEWTYCTLKKKEFVRSIESIVDGITSLPRQATIICLMIHGVELMIKAKDMVATDRVTASSTFTCIKWRLHNNDNYIRTFMMIGAFITLQYPGVQWLLHS